MRTQNTSAAPIVGDTLPQRATEVEAPRLELRVEREGGVVSARCVALDGDHLRIGSHPGNDLVLDDRHVSRFHCAISRQGGALRIRDLGSLNGTRVSGVPVRDADLPPPPCRLELGDSLVLATEVSPIAVLPVSSGPRFGALFGSSLPMRRLFAILERVSQAQSNVLIEGESGTGKELVAAEIVRRGPRAERPFVVVDCASISPNLMESTLFGHVRGAFTGAVRDRPGAFESADGGTVFLDEVGELPLELQPKLLRALEQREVCRVGETRPRAVDVRIVAATNRELEREVNVGRFREDLYFRLAVVTVRVPPLRARLDDLPLLVPAILDALGLAEHIPQYDDAALAELTRHSWPGNVRELRNYLERAVVMQSAGLAEPLRSTPPEAADHAPHVDIGVPLKQSKDRLVAAFERRYLEAMLAATGGNVSEAARRAGIDRMTVHRLIARYDLTNPRGRPSYD